ncbi:MAG: aldehyde dehydrogenase family protein [Oscillospiraceae bacterium]|nr:aldehyde dehydrogenase family protein [Oscillospiraceae bacterium]
MANARPEAYNALRPEQKAELTEKLQKARAAQKIIEGYSQETVDKLCQAVAWSVANKKTFLGLVDMSIQESKLGDYETRGSKRFKIRGILRDCLRQKSVGIIEEIPEKGIVKYAKPVGLIGCVVPTTNPDLTPAGNALYAIKARNVVLFAPHPRAKKTSFETVRLMREALESQGAPADILQCLENVSIPMTKALMAESDLIIATGGQDLVRTAYSSGTPAYGVGAGNSTMVIDETALQNIKECAGNTMLSKTSDFGSGCSADGNLVVHEDVLAPLKEALVAEGGYLLNPQEQAAVKRVMWDEECHRLADTVAIAPQGIAKAAGFDIPDDRKFLIAASDGIGPRYESAFCREKLTTLLTIHCYGRDFEDAIEMMKGIYEVGGKGHSCGVYSFDDEHIHRIALVAPASRMMIRQPQSKANAGAFNNGMPMTSSLGCGTWGGNIISENVNLKHYMNVTWVSRPIPEDRPDDRELFGEFYDPTMEV